MKYKKYPIFLYKANDNIKNIKRILKKDYKLRNENTSFNSFFIIGSGRSGNTLLRSILCNHEDISIPPESYVIPKIIRKFKSYNYLPWEEMVKIIVGEFQSHNQHFTWDINLTGVYNNILNLDNENRTLENIIDEIYKYYASIKFPEAKIWGDKTPLNTLNLQWLELIFNEAKYIHIIRDGRDVANSYLKMGRYESIKDATDRWIQSIEFAKKFGRKNPNRFMEIRYEDLVNNPEDIIKDICKFLEINYHKEMIYKKVDAEKLGDVSKLEHHKNVNKPISNSSIGKWKKEFNIEQQDEVNIMLKDYLKKLGYE